MDCDTVVDESDYFSPQLDICLEIVGTLKNEKNTVPYYLTIGEDKVYFSRVNGRLPSATFQQVQKHVPPEPDHTDIFNFIFAYSLYFDETELLKLVAPHVLRHSSFAETFLHACRGMHFMVKDVVKNIVVLMNSGLDIDKLAPYILKTSIYALSDSLPSKIRKRIDPLDRIRIFQQMLEDGKHMMDASFEETLEYEIDYYTRKYPDISLEDLISEDFINRMIDYARLPAYQFLHKKGLDIYAHDHLALRKSLMEISEPFIQYLAPHYRSYTQHVSILSDLYMCYTFDTLRRLRLLLENDIYPAFEQFTDILTHQIESLDASIKGGSCMHPSYILDKKMGEMMINIYRASGEGNFATNWKNFLESMKPGDIVVELTDNIRSCFMSIVLCMIRNGLVYEYTPILEKTGIIVIVGDVTVPIRSVYDDRTLQDMVEVLSLTRDDPVSHSIRSIVVIYGMFLKCIPVILLAMEHGARFEPFVDASTRMLFGHLISANSAEDIKQIIIDKSHDPISLAGSIWKICLERGYCSKAALIFSSYPVDIEYSLLNRNWILSKETRECVIKKFLSENPEKCITDMISENIDCVDIHSLPELFDYGFDPHWNNDIIWTYCCGSAKVSKILEMLKYYPNNSFKTILSLKTRTYRDKGDVLVLLKAFFEAGACKDDPEDMLEVARLFYTDVKNGIYAKDLMYQLVRYVLSKDCFEINRLIDQYATLIVGPEWKKLL